MFSTSISGITYGGTAGKEKFIAVGGDYISYSTDGVTWTRASGYLSWGFGLLAGPNSVAWGGNKYVAVGGQGVMYFSPDGINWAEIDGGYGTGRSQFDTANMSRINDIVYGGGKFLAVGLKYVSDGSFFGTSTGEMATSN
jgi:hypothetical protein